MNIFEFLVYASVIIIVSIISLCALWILVSGVTFIVKGLWTYITWGYKYPYSDRARENKPDIIGRMLAIILLILVGAACVFVSSLTLWSITRQFQ